VKNKMVNYYSKGYIDKIKQDVLEAGYTKDIPLDIFRNALMVCLGLDYKTADRWIRNYEETHIVDMEYNNEKGSWIINFK